MHHTILAPKLIALTIYLSTIKAGPMPPIHTPTKRPPREKLFKFIHISLGVIQFFSFSAKHEENQIFKYLCDSAPPWPKPMEFLLSKSLHFTCYVSNPPKSGSGPYPILFLCWPAWSPGHIFWSVRGKQTQTENNQNNERRKNHENKNPKKNISLFSSFRLKTEKNLLLFVIICPLYFIWSFLLGGFRARQNFVRIIFDGQTAIGHLGSRGHFCSRLWRWRTVFTGNSVVRTWIYIHSRTRRYASKKIRHKENLRTRSVLLLSFLHSVLSSISYALGWLIFFRENTFFVGNVKVVRTYTRMYR